MLPTSPLSDNMKPSSCQAVCFMHLSTEVELSMLPTSPLSDDMTLSSHQAIRLLHRSTKVELSMPPPRPLPNDMDPPESSPVCHRLGPCPR